MAGEDKRDDHRWTTAIAIIVALLMTMLMVSLLARIGGNWKMEPAAKYQKK